MIYIVYFFAIIGFMVLLGIASILLANRIKDRVQNEEYTVFGDFLK